MLCERYKEALIEAAALARAAEKLAPAVREHVEVCEDCQFFLQAQYELQSAIGEGLKLWVSVEAPEDLSVRVRRLVAGERRPRVRVLQWVVAGAAVAMALFLFMVRGGGRPGIAQTAPGEVAVNVVSRPGADVRVQQASPREKRRPPRGSLQDANSRTDAMDVRPLVQSGQRELIELVVQRMRNGELDGRILRWDAQGKELEELQVKPIEIDALNGEPGEEGIVPESLLKSSSQMEVERSTK